MKPLYSVWEVASRWDPDIQGYRERQVLSGLTHEEARYIADFRSMGSDCYSYFVRLDLPRVRWVLVVPPEERNSYPGYCHGSTGRNYEFSPHRDGTVSVWFDSGSLFPVPSAWICPVSPP
ncbi:hypothetical protein H6F43_03665 [Leptolyngbya sp. FACHB-36]|uniref:hypothetical protein n=1 Tax=Leptolyngbya sp. FACHB-36 TaxID=2692808 RepID=UPI001681465B|nr:hypothetical protein [Leptolyngbya sp. FACHB-36]MBD2019279.1 hypothetical protein [Leptolyngbya sp. FACHB-36]